MAQQLFEQTIELHPQAPQKPPFGAPCNGCGVCCAAEPCPLGRFISRRKSGRCSALEWNGDERRYKCGIVRYTQHYLRWMPHWLMAMSKPLLLRWIAAGKGCDSDASIE